MHEKMNEQTKIRRKLSCKYLTESPEDAFAFEDHASRTQSFRDRYLKNIVIVQRMNSVAQHHGFPPAPPNGLFCCGSPPKPSP